MSEIVLNVYLLKIKIHEYKGIPLLFTVNFSSCRQMAVLGERARDVAEKQCVLVGSKWRLKPVCVWN